MALLDSEVQRIKAELGYNVLTVGAEPYIGVTQIFAQVIQPYLSAGATTTSSTTVTAATSATPVTITLASGTGFADGARVVVDVDARQEVVTAQSVSGASLTVLLTLAHTGTYPVTVEGGETLIREKLSDIRTAREKIVQSFGLGALKRVDDIEWYQSGENSSGFEVIYSGIMTLRDELASMLGIENRWRLKAAAGARLSVY